MDENCNSVTNNDNQECFLNDTTLPSTRHWYHVSMRMIPCKASYFFIIAKETTFRMNFVLFCMAIGLTKSQAGLISGLRLIAVIVGAPFWGFLVDKYKNHRSVIFALCTVGIICTCLQPVVAYYFGDPNTNVCHKTVNYISFRSLNETTSSLITNHSIFNSTINSKELHHQQHSTAPFTGTDQNRLFLALFFINLFQAFFDGGLDCFIDLGVMQRIKEVNMMEGSNHKFGWQRVWGTLGNLGPIFGNLVVENFPSKNITCYIGPFGIYVILFICYGISLIIMFNGLRFPVDGIEKVGNVEDFNEDCHLVGDKSQCKQFLRSLLQFDYGFFVAILFILGIMVTQFFTFTFPYMKDIGSSTTQMDKVMIATTVAAGAGYLVGSKVIQIIGGYWPALALSSVSYFCRFLGTALIQNPTAIIFLQIFHMFSDAMTEYASVLYVFENTPHNILAAMYGFINAVQFSLAEIVGSSIGGVIYEYYGGSTLFLTSSGVSLLCFLTILGYLLYKKFIEDSLSLTSSENSELSTDNA